jgi:hypothetical protein
MLIAIGFFVAGVLVTVALQAVLFWLTPEDALADPPDDHPIDDMNVLMIQQLAAEGFLPPEDADALIARAETVMAKSRSRSAT